MLKGDFNTEDAQASHMGKWVITADVLTGKNYTVEGELNHRHLHLEALKMVNNEARRVHELELKANKERSSG